MHPSISSTLNAFGIAARNQDLARLFSIEPALGGDEHERDGVALANLATELMIREKRFHSTSVPQARTDVVLELTALGGAEDAAQLRSQVAATDAAAH